MNSEDIKLVEPAPMLRDAYMDFINEYHESGEEHIPGIGGMNIENFKE